MAKSLICSIQNVKPETTLVFHTLVMYIDVIPLFFGISTNYETVA